MASRAGLYRERKSLRRTLQAAASQHRALLLPLEVRGASSVRPCEQVSVSSGGRGHYVLFLSSFLAPSSSRTGSPKSAGPHGLIGRVRALSPDGGGSRASRSPLGSLALVVVPAEPQVRCVLLLSIMERTGQDRPL